MTSLERLIVSNNVLKGAATVKTPTALKQLAFVKPKLKTNELCH